MELVSIYPLLEEVRRMPWAYLDEPRLEHLSTFLLAMQGFSRWCDTPVDYGVPDFRHFGQWMAARRGDGLHGGGWQHFLAAESSGSTDLAAFFDTLGQFRRSELKVVERAVAVKPTVWPKYSDEPVAGGTAIVPTREPVVAVEIRGYLDAGAFYLVAAHRDGVQTERWCWTVARAKALADRELGVEATQWVPVIGVS